MKLFISIKLTNTNIILLSWTTHYFKKCSWKKKSYTVSGQKNIYFWYFGTAIKASCELRGLLC